MPTIQKNAITMLKAINILRRAFHAENPCTSDVACTSRTSDQIDITNCVIKMTNMRVDSPLVKVVVANISVKSIFLKAKIRATHKRMLTILVTLDQDTAHLT